MPNKSLYKYEALTVINERDDQVSFGNDILNDLIWAVDKKISLINAENAVADRTRRLKEAAGVSRDIVTNWLTADDQRSYWSEKFAYRKGTADKYTGADIELVVSDLDGKFLAEGRLAYIDYGRAALALETKDGESTLLDFCEEKPIPEDIDQNYHGHEATVALEVKSLPTASLWTWALRP